MKSVFPLAPRYRLDDESLWLEGIDPSRHYWIAVNGSQDVVVALPGAIAPTFDEFKAFVLSYRAMQPGDRISLERASGPVAIHCIGKNCYALEGQVKGAEVWHLFDHEALDSLLMTGHPDWQCAPQDIDLARRFLMASWATAAA